MILNHKYKRKIDWEYNINGNSFTAENRRLKKKKNINNKFINHDNLDFSNFNNIKNSNSPKSFFNTRSNLSSSNKSFSAIYYGILFFLLCGFLLFISISIGFASSNKTEDFNVNNFYDTEKSFKMLEQFIAESSKDNESDSSNQVNIENNVIKKVAFIKYRILKNDSVEKIAKKYSLWTDTILLSNNIESDRYLKIGTQIIIPNQNGRLITVSNNDSIFKIADKYGISWQKIVDTNDLKSSVISPGMRLFIPGSKMTSYEKDKFYSQKFIWPIKNALSSYFGPRIDPFTGAYGFHPGIDIKGNIGDKVKNVKDGKVLFTGWEKVYGNFIIIKYSDNIVITYGHLSKINVTKGQIVKQGEIIGLVGNTGRSTGPHLHFEVRKNGKLINPLTILDY